MRLRDLYDWIVLGDDPGALLSASLAARLGLSVLILPLPSGHAAPIRISAEDDLLDLESNFFLGLGPGGLVHKCLEHSGMVPQEESLIWQEKAVPQILTREARVALWPDRAMLETDLGRALGRDFLSSGALLEAVRVSDDGIEEFWAKLPERLTLKSPGSGGKPSGTEAAGKPEPREPKGVASLKKLSDQLARAAGRRTPAARSWFSQQDRIPQEFAEILLGASASLASTTVTASEQTPFDVLQLLALARKGASFKGGMSAFREFLLRLARRNGADLPPKTECRRIFIQNGKFAGVLPSSRGSMVGATGGVLGAPLEIGQSLLTVSGRNWWRKLKSPHVPCGWRFSLALTLHPEAISPGMSRRMLWQESGAPPLEIEVADPTDYNLKDRKKAVVFLRTILPMTDESLTPSYQRLVAARLLRKATEIAPFLEFHITRIYPDFRAQGSPELSLIYDFKTLEQIPPYLLCFEGEGMGAQSGVEGLFLSSRASFPKLGSFGSVVSALEGVAWVAHRSGLSGPLQS